MKELFLKTLAQERKKIEGERDKNLRELEKSYEEMIRPLAEAKERTKKQMEDAYALLFKQYDELQQFIEKNNNIKNTISS